MLRLSKSPLGLIGLAFAVSASAAILVTVPDEAAAKRIHFSKHRSSDTHQGASKHNEHAEDEASRSADGDGLGFSVRPKGSLPDEDQEEKKPAAAEMTKEPSEPGAAPAEAAQENSPATPEQSTKSAEDNNAPSSTQQPDAATSGTTTAKREPVLPKPHPIAAAQPGMDVIVCEAGCANASETQEAVYVQVSTARDQAASVGELKPSSSAETPAPDAMKDMIVCLGGCYDTPKAYRSTIAGPDVAAGSWTATVVPTSAKPADAGSGTWMRRIDDSRGTEPAKPDKQ